MENAEETTPAESRVVTMVFLPLVNLEPNMVAEIKGRHLLVIRTGEGKERKQKTGKRGDMTDDAEVRKMLEDILPLYQAAEDALQAIQAVSQTRLEYEAHARLTRAAETLAGALGKSKV